MQWDGSQTHNLTNTATSHDRKWLRNCKWLILDHAQVVFNVSKNLASWEHYMSWNSERICHTSSGFSSWLFFWLITYWPECLMNFSGWSYMLMMNTASLPDGDRSGMMSTRLTWWRSLRTPSLPDPIHHFQTLQPSSLGYVPICLSALIKMICLFLQSESLPFHPFHFHVNIQHEMDQWVNWCGLLTSSPTKVSPNIVK